jgi:hypothetical protein
VCSLSSFTNFTLRRGNSAVEHNLRGEKIVTSSDEGGSWAERDRSPVAGLKYRAYFKTKLTDATWQNLAGDQTATGTSATKVDTLPMSTPQRFHRVLVVDQNSQFSHVWTMAQRVLKLLRYDH